MKKRTAAGTVPLQRVVISEHVAHLDVPVTPLPEVEVPHLIEESAPKRLQKSLDLPGLPEDSDLELLEDLKTNYVTWKPFKRVSAAWAFWAPIPGAQKTQEDGRYDCLVCKKYTTDHQSIKQTVFYKERSGTSGLRNHCEKNHPGLWQNLLPFVAAPRRDSGPRTPTARSPRVPKPLALTPVRSDDARLTAWIEQQILCHAKGLMPLSLLDEPLYVQHWQTLLPLAIPSKQDFKLAHIPTMHKKALDFYVSEPLSHAQVVALSWDEADAVTGFLLNAHFLVEEQTRWRRVVKCLGIVQSDSPQSTNEVLARFPGLDKRIIGYTARDTEDSIGQSVAKLARSEQFPALQNKFKVACQLSSVAQAFEALEGEVELHARLLKALAWPYKSAAVRRIWETRAPSYNLPQALPALPLRSRPSWRIDLYELASKYRPLLDDIHNPEYNPAVTGQNKRLTDSDWKKIQQFVERNQAAKATLYLPSEEGFWSLSDAVASNIKLARELYPDNLPPVTRTYNFPLGKLVQSLDGSLDFLTKFDATKSAYMLSLMLDHRFKQLGHIAGYFRGQPPREVLDRYTDTLLSLALDTYTARKGHQGAVPPPAPAFGVDPRYGSIYGEPEAVPSGKSVVLDELERFRRYPVSEAEAALSPLQWWAQLGSNFPCLLPVARAIFTLPGSHAPAERSLSLAGFRSLLRQRNMSTELREDLLFISRNWPEPHSAKPAEPELTPEELAHQFQNLELH